MKHRPDDLQMIQRDRRLLKGLGGVLVGLAVPFMVGIWSAPLAITVPCLLGVGAGLLAIGLFASDRWVARVANVLILWP